MRVSVIGLGKLGLCTAVCFAAKGHRVHGVDSNQDMVTALQQRNCPIDENDLPRLLDRSWKNLIVSTNTAAAVIDSDITLIIVPTPSTDRGDFSNDYVLTVLEEIAQSIRKKNSFHVVGVVSTVMPGSCENLFRPMLENATGLTCGKDFGLVYNPEFIALGSVIRNFLNPDMVLIGASDRQSSDLTRSLYRSTCDNMPSIRTMSLINAEITKISLNCYVTTKISFANQLAAICEKVSGADVDAITSAMGEDSRIGKKYLQGGLGFGGPCFPRDNIAFQYFANETGTPSKLGTEVVAINHEIVNRHVNLISKHTVPGGKVVFLGLSYKPGTHIIEESQAVMIAAALARKGHRCVLYDPLALEEAKKALGELVDYVEDPYQGFVDADAIVVMANSPEYLQIDWRQTARLAKDKALLVDTWRILKDQKLDGFVYRGMGLGPGQPYDRRVTEK